MEFFLLVLMLVLSIGNFVVLLVTVLKRKKVVEKIESKGNRAIHICRPEDRGANLTCLGLIAFNIVIVSNIDSVRSNLLSIEWIVSSIAILFIGAAIIIRMTLKGVIYEEGILTGRNKFISWIEISEIYARLSMLDTFYELEIRNKQGKKFEIQVKKKDIKKVDNIVSSRSDVEIKYSKIILE
ncbi:hypothetical protein [Clostridium sp.]|uniref:hypothetical protein n=1 Tax=Clostridium sp. TaxID=1506 RepID=UPI002FCA94DF